MPDQNQQAQAQGQQPNPADQYNFTLDVSPHDSIEVRALKEYAATIDHDRQKQIQANRQLELDLHKHQVDQQARRMANLRLQQQPPVIQAPRLVFKNPQEEQLSQKETTNEILAQVLQSQQTLLKAAKRGLQPHDDLMDAIQGHETALARSNITIQTTKTQMKDIGKVAQQYKPNLPFPTNLIDVRRDDVPRILEPRTIIQTIKPFNPDAKPEQDFADTWRFIRLHCQNDLLTEQEYIFILNYCLMGDAHRLYTDLVDKNKSLQDILEAFTKLYTKRRTINDDIHDINTFRRKPSEPIYKTMQRATILTERIENLYTPAAWPEIKTRILKCLLIQVVSLSTRKFVETEEHKLKRLGIDMDFEALIDLIEDHEKAHNQIPTQEMETTINAFSGTIKTNAELMIAKTMVQQPPRRSPSRYYNQERPSEPSLNRDIKDLKEQFCQLNAIIQKRNKFRSPSPNPRPPQPAYGERPSRKTIDSGDVHMKDTSSYPSQAYPRQQSYSSPQTYQKQEAKPTTSAFHRSPTPGPKQTSWHTSPKPTSYYDAHKSSQQNRSYSQSPNRSYGNTSYGQTRYNDNKYRSNSYNKPSQWQDYSSKYPDRSKNQSYDQGRYSTQRYDNRSNSYDRKKYDEGKRFETRSSSYDRNKYDSRNRSTSNDRYRNYSGNRNRGEYRKPQDQFGTNDHRSTSKPRQKDDQGHAVNVLINSNENICDICKKYMKLGTLCLKTGQPHAPHLPLN